MAINYSISTTDGVTTVRFTTEPGVGDVCNAIDDVAENDQSVQRLWDLSNGFNLAATELKKIAEYGKSKFLIPAKAAIIAPKDLAFGLARMHDVYREDDFVTQKVFRSEQEARVWLKS